MIYPSVIMFVALAIVTLLMMVVVPQFESIFEQMHVELLYLGHSNCGRYQ